MSSLLSAAASEDAQTIQRFEYRDYVRDLDDAPQESEREAQTLIRGTERNQQDGKGGQQSIGGENRQRSGRRQRTRVPAQLHGTRWSPENIWGERCSRVVG